MGGLGISCSQHMYLQRFRIEPKMKPPFLLDIHCWKAQTMAIPQKCSFLPTKWQKTSMVLKEQ